MNKLTDWLRLYHAPGVGPATYKQLLERYHSPTNVFACDAIELTQAGLRPTVVQAILAQHDDAVERDLNWLAASDSHHIITLGDDAYPQQLKEIPGDPPPLLYIKGSATLAKQTQIAIIGSRNPSTSGEENARHFARSLAQHGICVTSGLALGIDAAAHQGALQANSATLAVCATGLDTIYPKRHHSLSNKILENQGAIISEFPIGTPPNKENFPRRNRIISGLSLGTLVIEAAPRSGSLITARHAMEQNREVFAIPGSIHNPLAKGCHALIKQGAKLVESVDDILEEISFIPIKTKDNGQIFQENLIKPITLSGDQLAVFQEIGYEPTAPDTLVRRSGLTADVVSSILMELELQRYITSTVGGYYSRER